MRRWSNYLFRAIESENVSSAIDRIWHKWRKLTWQVNLLFGGRQSDTLKVGNSVDAIQVQ
jgi:hypothetical protein